MEPELKTKPTLSSKTQQLASKRKQKLDAQGLHVVDNLYRKATLAEQKKRERAEKMLKEREEDPEATFHPQTLQYERQPGATHGDKCLDLYSRWQTNTKISRL